MLACARLGDDARLAHALGQEDLPEAVVDLVSACVVQVLALEVDLRAAQVVRQMFGKIKRARPADIMLQKSAKLGLESRVLLRLRVGSFQLEEQRHQGFGDIT